MTECTNVIVREKFYLDSVALMRYSQTLARMPGVLEAAMMMATPSNLEIMQNAGLIQIQQVRATPGDLVIAVRGDRQTSVDDAISKAEELLDTPTSAKTGTEWRPKSIRSAVATNPDANLALISVPGAYAVAEARKAIHRGMHAMIFSDNVPVEQEAQLKREALELNQLVMGPDCGTAIINGVPLAFANSVPRGPISVVGASGTGMQEITSLIAQNGFGIAQAIGVGGRDLHDTVGGVSTLMALDALKTDRNTQHIVVVSKPPSTAIAERVLKKIEETGKSATVCFLGGEPMSLPDNCQWARNLSDAAELAMAAMRPVDDKDVDKHKSEVVAAASANTQTTVTESKLKGQYIRGLYCGGTLCTEALVECKRAGFPVASNVALADTGPATDTQAHLFIDLGADEYTAGKPHPMIEPSIRDEHVKAALMDDDVSVLLIDLVIGYGSHVDPASVIVNALQACGPLDKPVLASVTGTESDPQVRSVQIAKLQRAGVAVYPSNAAAVQQAIALIDEHA